MIVDLLDSLQGLRRIVIQTLRKLLNALYIVYEGKMLNACPFMIVIFKLFSLKHALR